MFKILNENSIISALAQNNPMFVLTQLNKLLILWLSIDLTFFEAVLLRDGKNYAMHFYFLQVFIVYKVNIFFSLQV